MQRFHSITDFQFKGTRLKIGLFLSVVFLNAISNALCRQRKYIKNILITGLLMASSNNYACEIDWDNPELEDFQDTKQSCTQSLDYNDYYGSAQQIAEYEKIEEILKKHWEEHSYSVNENQLMNNKLN